MQTSCLKHLHGDRAAAILLKTGYPSLRFPNMVKVNILEHWTRVTRFNSLWVSDVIHRRGILFTRPSRRAIYQFKTRTGLYELNEDEELAQCQKTLNLKNRYHYDRCKPRFVSRLRKPVLLFEVVFAFGLL